jgi:SAM-dependent methyltransferase
MRSAELRLESYNTDKVANGYLQYYDPVFAELVGRELRLLEIGVHEGGSLKLWRDYFPKGRITGVDLRVPPGLEGEARIAAYAGDQSDTAFLTDVAGKSAPEGFDVIIDDASHLGVPTRAAFWHLFERHLKPGGLYVIEDWGTGYWDDWPDGRAVRPPSLFEKLLKPRNAWPAHSFGMVGFIKELIDEQGAADLTRARWSGKPARRSKFEWLKINPSVVFVKKAPRPA